MDAPGEHDVQRVELDIPLRNVKGIYVGATVAFVPHPYINGAWMRTDPSVRNHCPVCDALPGELCMGTRGRRTGSLHFRRSDRYVRKVL